MQLDALCTHSHAQLLVFSEARFLTPRTNTCCLPLTNHVTQRHTHARSHHYAFARTRTPSTFLLARTHARTCICTHAHALPLLPPSCSRTCTRMLTHARSRTQIHSCSALRHVPARASECTRALALARAFSCTRTHNRSESPSSGACARARPFQTQTLLPALLRAVARACRWIRHAQSHLHALARTRALRCFVPLCILAPLTCK
mmetsp:Transcript_41115/g.86068  ORF Transcript_41115/g.86068 Transcript_41115/m.86068 type:complete len:204 (-) Transcript_41115:316-927(-)